MSLPTPITRKESYLAAIAGEQVQVPEKPITREEAYLDAIAKGGGGGGTIDPVPTEGSTNAVSSGGTYTALAGKLDASEKGTASGVAELDANGKVLSSQLPSFVDDVVEGYYDSTTDRFYEESTFETVIDPVEGKSWVDIPANKSYRWTGTVYVRVDEGVQIGDTSNSAFRGDWGKALKDTMGTGALDTTAQTVIPAINELNTGKANTSDITNAINALDVSSVGGTGKYISAISEADGKINATAETMDEVPTQDSNKPVKSGGVFNAIDDSVSLKTATGNPITLTDAANANAEELSMTIEPVQSGSGDPSPTNVRPISGLTEGKVVACGKNIAHIDSTKIYSTDKDPSDPITGITDGMLILSTAANGYIRGVHVASYTINNANSITVKMADTAGSGAYGIGIVVEIDDTKTYTLNLSKTGGDATVGWLNSDGSCLSYADRWNIPITLTPPSGAKYAMIFCCPGRNAEHTFSDIQLEEGTTATPYEPYTANTATITLGRTVYGGSVNFKTGEVTVTHGMVDLGTLNWEIQTTSGVNRFQTTVAGAKGPILSTDKGNLTCSNYSVIDWYNGTRTSSADKTIFIVGGSGNTVGVRDSSYNDATAFKTAMSGVQLCYELATPTTLTLTPAELELLKGNNTITANGAEISIEYYPDNAIGALAGRVDDLDDDVDSLEAQIDSKVEEVSVTVTVTQGAGEDRAKEIISGVLNANVIKTGTNVIAVYHGGIYRATLLYSEVGDASAYYGRGLLIDYYDNATYEFENRNRTITIGKVLTNKSDVVSYKAGDVIANENVVAVAVGSSSNTNDCYFSIPLSKPVVATSVSVSVIACSLYYGTDQKMSITGATFTGTINKGSILVKATSENSFIQNARYVVDFNGTFTFS